MNNPRQEIYDVIQAQAGIEDSGAPEGAVLLGFLVVAEWEAPDSERWLSKISGDSGRRLPQWRERGMASEVVFHWPVPDEEEC